MCEDYFENTVKIKIIKTIQRSFIREYPLVSLLSLPSIMALPGIR